MGGWEEENELYHLLGQVSKLSSQKPPVRDSLCLCYGVAEAQGSLFEG